MKSSLYKILSQFIIIAFLFYWVLSIALSLSSSVNKGKLGEVFPRFNRLFGHSWNLFVQSFNYDDRVYLIVRNRETKAPTDSIELLGDIAYQKKIHAPFNQAEYIVDRLVNHNTTLIKHRVVELSKIITHDFPGIPDSVYREKLADLEKKDGAFVESMGTLDNYCKLVLAKKNIDTTGKEFKLIIRERDIKPFDQRNNASYVTKEIIYFESSYNPFEK